ncbi:Lsm family RNA-binding protein [Vulcanisaeta sp. JCM 16161]|uniref:Lsm family RNA-binding protein n=1 Tax=Vulcanisaeta sp. JCM 16161 TaxID=1295372 RepID=UPI0006D13D0C|nr:Lsm family RNA-binding protein [Vulcanisaeta sp. JCM 16161]
MSLLADATRRFNAELLNMVNKEVRVTTSTGTTYQGMLVGIDSSLNIMLVDAVNNKNERFSRVLVMSHAIVDIVLVQEFVDLREFARYIDKYFPGMVKYVEEANVVQVGNVKVTTAGVEGSGPLAKRVKELFDEFMSKRRA